MGHTCQHRKANALVMFATPKVDMEALIEASCAPTPATRPDGCVYICFKSQWRQNDPDPTMKSSQRQKLKVIEACAPDRWAHVRYYIERELGFHALTERRTSFVSAVLITDFSTPSLKKQTELNSDTFFVDEDSVLVISRKPLPLQLARFVPGALAGEFRCWYIAERARLATLKKQRTGGRQKTKTRCDERNFATEVFRFRSNNRTQLFPRGASNVHTSNLPPGTNAPPWYICKRCGVRGDHLDSMCSREEALANVTPLKRKRMIHGIPKNELEELDPHSIEGRTATLKDAEGRVYKHARGEAVAFLNSLIKPKSSNVF